MTMAHNDNFVRFSQAGSLTSDSEYDVHPSDTDATSSQRNGQVFRPTDYWFGKKYFECIIAQGVFEDAGNNDSIEAVDSLYEQVLRSYPYQEAVDQLRSKSPGILGSGYFSRDTNDYTVLMTFLGMTIRIGEQKDKRTILDIVRNCQGKDVSDGDKSSTTTAFGNMRFKSESPRNDHLSQFDEGDGPSIDTYTSRLKEMGDQEGWQPKYQGGRYHKDPTLFQTTVFFAGFTHDGPPAKNSRLAKHRASKVACDFLDDQRRNHDKMSDR